MYIDERTLPGLNLGAEGDEDIFDLTDPDFDITEPTKTKKIENPTSNKLIPRIGIGALAESLQHIVCPGEGVAGTVWQSGKPLIIDNYDQWSGRISKFSKYSISSIIGVPLLSGKELIGVLGLAHEDDSNKTFGNKDIEYLSQFARLVTLAIQNAQLYSELQQELADRKKAEFLLQNYMERLEEIVAKRTLELEETQEKLVRQERLAAIGQLAGSIGHELRNPLGVITNVIYYLRLILSDAPENIIENLNLINAEAHRASKIISDLLDFARLKSVDHSPTKILDLINTVLVQNPAPENIDITVNFPDVSPTVLVDAVQINQVLTNLVTNAYQAMPQGGQLIIDFDDSSSSDTGNPMLAVRIQDTGIGIAPEHMEKIFEPLFTTKNSGIGLGLPLSLKLMEANDGTIRATSTPGENTTFTLYFPIRKDLP